MFTGCGTAMVTPFRRDGSLDETTLRNLIQRQIDAGIDFLVPCGTTGESPTLTHEEHLRVVEITVETSAEGKVPVLAGAGGYNTAEVIALARELAAIGVDGILSVTPYYNKPTQEGLYQHYRAIAEAVALPIILVQRARPHRSEHRACDGEAACGNRKHRWHQGSVGKHRANGGDSEQRAGRFHRAVRRRCDHAAADRARRARSDFRRLE